MLVRGSGQDLCNNHPQPYTFHQPPPASGHHQSCATFRTDTADATTLHMRVNCIVTVVSVRNANDCAAAARGSVDKRLVDGAQLCYCRHPTTALAPSAVTAGAIACAVSLGVMLRWRLSI